MYCSSLASSSPTRADARASPLVGIVCMGTRDFFGQNYSQCVKTFCSTNDLKELAINILKVAAETAKDAKELLNSYQPVIKSCKETKAIQQCAQSYGSIASCFQGTQDEVNEEETMANYTVVRIFDDNDACEKSMSSDGVKLPNSISTRLQLVKLYYNHGLKYP
ncbi:hypothetical protein DVH24_037754 [Malus domestica]|uniref:Pectinesterase inhibitor domain-containing protein n=1 Tax=Malus domestica TaxID=3750 RepID=A0A498JY98_MALDO|nr:hypothetical protein DVH24_037754 [Malus domestica]